MLEKNYRNIIYFISITILVTIVAQAYWNYKNFELNKQQVHNQIKTSFDNSIEKYYTEIAINEVLNETQSKLIVKNDDSGWIKSNSQKINMFLDIRDSVVEKLPKNISLYSLKDSSINQKTISYYSSVDSLPFKLLDHSSQHNFDTIIMAKIDSSKVNELTTKVIMSFQEDIIDLKKIDSLFKVELQRKKLSIEHGFNFEFTSHFSLKKQTKKYQLENLSTNYLTAKSNSSFLPPLSILELRYINPANEVFKKTVGSILLSFLLSGIIIGCLLFLFKTIARQKQLAEVKNDLISNITHEFKTPISTIGVAIESIKNFNVIDDKKKTKNYLDISSDQLSKLNLMVEKLLETATLDSEALELNKEKINVSELIESLADRYKLQAIDKKISYQKSEFPIIANVDIFHFENAINNIIDNAIKYGGNDITIDLKKLENDVIIEISDNGFSLTKEKSKQIFEKFYRVSKGNTHDVKGFGIGLYYCKKIIEKHEGNIQLKLKNKLTTFKISLPDD